MNQIKKRKKNGGVKTKFEFSSVLEILKGDFSKEGKSIKANTIDDQEDRIKRKEGEADPQSLLSSDSRLSFWQLPAFLTSLWHVSPVVEPSLD